MSGGILVVGALHWDVVVRAPRIPGLDETLRGSAVAYRFGGKGGNQARAAAQGGARVAFGGRVGDDAPGRTMRATLEAEGIDTTYLQDDPGASGMSVAIVEDGGGYQAVIVSAANLAIDPGRIDVSPGTTLLLLQNEIPGDVNLDMARRARRAGAAVILNAAPAPGIDPALVALTDILVVNRVEAAQLLGVKDLPGDPRDALGDLQALTAGGEVIVTLGSAGVAFTGPEGPQIMAAPRVEVRSTHGAGDAFVGTWAAARAQRAGMTAAVARAQEAAARLVASDR